MRIRISAAILIASLGLFTAAHAADPKPEAKPDPKKEGQGQADPKQFPPIIDRQHHLGPGDVIEITVENYPDLSKTVRLYTDGTFDYPILGAIQSAGLTIKELQAQLVELFKKELRRPVVYVSLREIFVPPMPEVKIPKITALGAVSRKGEMDLPEPRPLRVVLANIGPLENADLSKIRVRYPDGSAREADFSKFATIGPEAVKEVDFEIKGGEEIVLLEKPLIPKPDPIKFTILGAVAKPGTHVVETPISILEMLEKVGGPQPGAELEKVKVIGPAHKDEQYINIEKYVDGDVQSNYISQNGDVLVIEQKPNRVLLVGEVGKKGWVTIEEGATLMNTLLLEGTGATGDYSRTQLVRRGPDGKPVFTTINVRDIEKKKKEDIKLQPQDVIFVPRKKERKSIIEKLGNLLSPVWLLRSVAPVP